MKKVICQSDSAKKTQECGQNIKLDNLICLWGDLGSGKTTLVKGIARALKVNNTITSPSFLIFKVYEAKHEKYKRLVHVDLYRLEKNINFSKLGLEEYFNDPYTLVVIEWPNKIKKHLPRKRIDVKFEIVSEEKRKITLIYF